MLLISTVARAALPVFFEMDRCVGDAKLIVHGFLDEKGNIEMRQVLKGEQPLSALTLADGSKTYLWLSNSMKDASVTPSNTIEVVAFLGGQIEDVWQPVMGYVGVAGLVNTNVYLCSFGTDFRDEFRQPTARRDKHFDRDSFLAAVTAEIKVSGQQDALLSLPRSAERVQKLVSFLLEHGGSYHRWRITESLRPIDSDEQKEILREIANTNDIATKCFLIGLAGDLPLSTDAFNSIAPLIEKENPRTVRRAAMWAISRINPPEATELILPLITTKESELDAALVALESPNNSPLDSKATDVLLSLSKEVRRHDADHTHSISGEEQQALHQQLAQYVHPKLISFYFDWLLQERPASPDYVTSDIQAMLGVQWPRSELEAWWKQQRKIIEPVYNLQNSHDQKKWFAAYQGADEVSQHLLVRLWMFTSGTNQLALVKAATEGKTAAAAKATITELWKAEHLSNEGKKAMFKNFLKVDFVDETNLFGWKNHSEFHIYGAALFPFNTWINYRYTVAVDGKQVWKSSFQDGIELEPSIKQFELGSLSGPFLGQAASATLEIHQLDHYPDGKELWHAQWNLGPIKLREE